jgi:hypothetical protein
MAKGHDVLPSAFLSCAKRAHELERRSNKLTSAVCALFEIKRFTGRGKILEMCRYIFFDLFKSL